MLDTKKVITLDYKNKDGSIEKVDLMADFDAFKRLHKITGNAFAIIDEFANDEQKRIDHLPTLIKAMATKELSLDEIKNQWLGMSWVRVINMSSIILSLLMSELTNEVKEEVEVSEKNI